MPQPYPQPSINSSFGVIEYANTVTDGWMVILFTMAMVIITFLILQKKGYKISDSLLVSFILAITLCSFLWVGGLLAGKVLVILLVLTISSAIYSIFDT